MSSFSKEKGDDRSHPQSPDSDKGDTLSNLADHSLPARKPGQSKIGMAPINGVEAVATGAEEVLRSMLHDAARDIKDRHLRAYYRNEKLPTADLIGVLRHADREDRQDLLTQLLLKAAEAPEWIEPVKRRLPYLVYSADAESRAYILKAVLAVPKSNEQQELIVSFLRSCKTLEQLKDVSELVGVDKLLAFQNSDIKDVLSKAYLGYQIRDIKLPSQVPTLVSRRQAHAVLERAKDELEQALKECITICKSDPIFSKTESAKLFRDTAQETLSELNADWEHNNTSRNRRTVLHRKILETHIQFNYGINISTQRGATPWSETALREVQKALDAFPGDMIVLNPVVREIKLKPAPKDKEKSEELHAAIWDSKTLRIEIFDDVVSKKFKPSKDYPEERLRYTIAHEVWHGVLQGDRRKSLPTWHDRTTGEIDARSANPEWDFDLFCKKSDWRLVTDERRIIDSQFKNNERGVLFTLTGDEFRLGRPVKYQGKPMVFSYSDGDLYSRDPFATFPGLQYSETNPYEHFVEAGASYLLCPEILITYSPKDFEYFEKRLRMYDDPNSPILKLYRAKVDQDLREKRNQ